MNELSVYKEKIKELQETLESKDQLLQFTRSYADQLLAQVNHQVENIQEQQRLLELQHRQLVESIHCARHVLSVVTTSQHELQKAYPESFIIFKPKDLIGGDFFWKHRHGDKLFVAVGDCTGHGVSGGILSLMGDMLLRQAVIEHGMGDPNQILKHVDITVSGMASRNVESTIDLHEKRTNVTSDIAIDMLIAVHDTQSEILHISSAHMPYFLWQEGKLERRKGGNGSIGVRKKNKEFSSDIIEIKADTTLYFTTDGFADQFKQKEVVDEKSRKFGRSQMIKMLEHNAGKDLGSQKENILTSLQEWKGHEPQTDDIMMLGINYSKVDRG